MTGSFTAAVLIALTGVINSADVGLKWNDHYGHAKQVAQSTQRPMVVILEKPGEQDTEFHSSQLSAQDRVKLAAQKFELCRVDVTTEYGQRVADAFGAKEFPYFAVTDKVSRKIVFRKAGSMSDSDWSNALAKSETTKTQVVRKVITEQPAVTARPVVVEQPQPSMIYEQAPTYSFPQQIYTPSYCPSCQMR